MNVNGPSLQSLNHDLRPFRLGSAKFRLPIPTAFPCFSSTDINRHIFGLALPRFAPDGIAIQLDRLCEASKFQ
jgi:hypothetical protein